MGGLTWTEQKLKFQRLARDDNGAVLTQAEQDMNTGYHLFNAKLARYYTRKQQFTDLVAGQDIYQTPIDSVRVMGITVAVNATYEPTVKQVVSEYLWRQMKSYKTFATNWPSHYYILGSDQLQLYPTPSQSLPNGLRYYYQPQDHDLSVDDVTSASTNTTVTVMNGSNLVTATGGAFSADMASLMFQVTGVTDLSWYEITAATSTTLTLKSAYVGTSGSLLNWRVGQMGIISGQYAEAPMHHALGLYFSGQGNESRGDYHRNLFESMMTDCLEEYSSSSTSRVITSDDVILNAYLVPPVPG